jgi:hypothetical protein
LNFYVTEAACLHRSSSEEMAVAPSEAELLVWFGVGELKEERFPFC